MKYFLAILFLGLLSVTAEAQTTPRIRRLERERVELQIGRASCRERV